MGLNGSIEGSNPSFSVSATPRSRTPAEGWQSGRMRRSRKPLSVQADRRFKSSPLRSIHPESDAGNRIRAARGTPLRGGREGTEGHRDLLRSPRTGARPARAGDAEGLPSLPAWASARECPLSRGMLDAWQTGTVDPEADWPAVPDR